VDTAERSADDFALGFALATIGVALVERNSAAVERGLQLLRQVREMSVGDRFYRVHLPFINAWIGRGVARSGDREGALPVLRSANDDLFVGGQFGHCTATTRLLVQELLVDSAKIDFVRSWSPATLVAGSILARRPKPTRNPAYSMSYVQVFYRLQGKQSPKSFQNLCFPTCSRDLPHRVGAAGQVTERVACTTRGRKM
jgi:hypothetical protein